MQRRTITKVALPLFVALFLISSSSVNGQGLQSELAQRVKAFDSESSSTVRQLVDFAQRFQIPMGIELAIESEQSVAPPIHARNTTAQRIIQQIVHERPCDTTGFSRVVLQFPPKDVEMLLQTRWSGFEGLKSMVSATTNGSFVR